MPSKVDIESTPCHSKVDGTGDGGKDTDISEEEQLLIKALANRSYHLPGYDLCQDIRQYLNNNHPILSICFHHKLHPVTRAMRLMTLLGSILCGLTISNIFFLIVLSDERFQHDVFVMTINGAEWGISLGMLMLCTVGGSLHAFYDLMLFYFLSCGCWCPLSQKWRSYGKYVVVVSMVLLLAAASFVVLLRASVEHSGNDIDVLQLDSVGLVDDAIALTEIDKEDVRFLLGYIVEFSLALLVFYPIGSLTLFSGILGCGKVPVLGGRPWEVSREYRLKRTREDQARGIDP